MGSIRLSAEDGFAVVDMVPRSRELFTADSEELWALRVAAQNLEARWRFILDYREAKFKIYGDMEDAYDCLTEEWRPYAALVSPWNRRFLQSYLFTEQDRGPASVIAMRAKALPTVELDLTAFFEGDDYINEYFVEQVASGALLQEQQASAWDLGFFEDDGPGQLPLHSVSDLDRGLDYERAILSDRFNAYVAALTSVTEQRAAALNSILSSVASNSLLAEVAIFVDTDAVHVVPYHGFSIHSVENRQDDLVLVRPARASRLYWREFAHAIASLEALLNTGDPSEKAIERILVDNPLFLRGLNYQSVYSQVVLPRADTTSLRPDIIAEPADGSWSDIIEIKRPTAPVLVGRDNRPSLAAAIHEVVSQLREYSAYFDDRRLAKRVEDRYGFRCYRPRLVAIIGRDPTRFTKEQVRRAMTAYPDLEVVTYDELLRAARRLVLL